jgi:hypothetical protein
MATFEDLSVFDERNGELAINGIVCGYFVGLWPLLWMIESYHTPPAPSSPGRDSPVCASGWDIAASGR